MKMKYALFEFLSKTSYGYLIIAIMFMSVCHRVPHLPIMLIALLVKEMPEMSTNYKNQFYIFFKIKFGKFVKFFFRGKSRH